MSDNEFDLGIDLGAAAPQELPPVTKKKAPKKKAAAPVVDDPVITSGVKKEVAKQDKEERVKIWIDEVPGMSNYEFVGVNGVAYQIKRGCAVEVPIGVMYALQDAVMTQTEIRRNPITGEREEIVRHHSAIPWRRV